MSTPNEPSPPRGIQSSSARTVLGAASAVVVIAALAFLFTSRSPLAAAGHASDALLTPTSGGILAAASPVATDTPTSAPLPTDTPQPPAPTATPVYFTIAYTCAYGQHLGQPNSTTYTGFLCFHEPQLAGDVVTYTIYLCGADTSTLSVNIVVPASGAVDATTASFGFTAACSPATVRGVARVSSDSSGLAVGDADGFSFSVS